MKYIENYKSSDSSDTSCSPNSYSDIDISKNNGIFPYYAIPKDMHDGTIEILKIIECNVRDFNEKEYIKLVYASKSIKVKEFFEKYGDNILKISQELSDLNMCYLTISWNSVIIEKKGFKNLKSEYRNTFYKSQQKNKEKFITDVNRLYEEGFVLVNYDMVFDDEDKFLGYLATFKK